MNAIAGLDEEGFRARPVSGEWTAAEVLAHLLADEPKLLAHAQSALEADDIAVEALSDEDREKQAKNAAQRMPVPQILHGLLAARRDTLRQLDALSPDQLARPVRHAAYGDTTVARLFQHIAEHEEAHATQIQTIRVQTDRNRRDTSAL